MKAVFLSWQKKYMDYILSETHEKLSFEYALSHGMEVLDPEEDMKSLFPEIRDQIIKDYLKKSGEKGKQALDLLIEALQKNPN